jgi:hypothetical protein
MIGVRVSKQNRIEPLQTRPESLLAKIGRRINDEDLISVFDQYRSSKSFVARIV